jgi:hypothetical protein
VFVDLGIQHAMRMRPARLYNIFPHYLKNATIFQNIIEHKMSVLIFSTNSVWNISHSKKKWARSDKKYVLIVM